MSDAVLIYNELRAWERLYKGQADLFQQAEERQFGRDARVIREEVEKLIPDGWKICDVRIESYWGESKLYKTLAIIVMQYHKDWHEHLQFRCPLEKKKHMLVGLKARLNKGRK